MTSITIDTLRSDAAAIANGLNECWSAASAVTHVADVLLRLHPGIPREQAIVAAEQSLWAGWPR